MPTLPLSFSSISLLLAVTAIILLVTAEMLSPYYGRAYVRINRKRLNQAAIVVSLAFLATVAARIIGILLPR
jgi:hypothetical protein